MFLVTTGGKDIALNIEDVKEIFSQNGETIVNFINSGKTYKVTQTIAEIKAQAPRNLFVQVTGTDGVVYLLFDYRILQITELGTGSRITFKFGGVPRNVVETPSEIVNDFSTGGNPNIQIGTTAQRPASPAQGQQYIDTDLGNQLIYYVGTDWLNVTGEIAD